MFEAYKVGVTLSLQNQVSSVLGFIARDFIKVDKEAKKLQATLREIKLLGMGGAILGGAGFLGLGMIKSTLEPAKEYVNQLTRMNMAGMKQKEIAEAIAASWKNTGVVMTSTVTSNLATIGNIRAMTAGGTEEAIRLLPITSKIAAVMAASNESKYSAKAEDTALAMVRALDIIGATNDPSGKEVEKQAAMMSKVILSTFSKVTPQMFQGVFAYARQGKYGMSNEFKYEILPTIMEERASGTGGGGGGSKGVGPAIAALYRVTNQGYVNKKSLSEWQKLGYVDAHTALKTTTTGTTVGSMRDSEKAASNSFLWALDLVAKIKSVYGSKATPEFIKRELGGLFRGNQLAADLVMEYFVKEQTFERNQARIRGAQDYNSAYDTATKMGPLTADQMVTAQWTNLKTVLGLEVIPVLIPFLHKLAEGLRSLTAFARDNPGVTTGIVGTFAALSGLAATSGALMIVGAGIKLLNIGFVALSGVPLVTVGTGLGAVATGLSVLATPVAALMAILGLKAAYKDSNIYKHTFGAVGALYDIVTSPYAHGGAGFAPPASGKPVQVHTQVNLDGHQIAKVVTKHQAKAMNTPMSGTSGFDGRMSYVPSGATGAW